MQRPEIVIGLVGAIGTDLDAVADAVKAALDEVNYRCLPIRLSTLLKDYPDPAPYDKTTLTPRYHNDYVNAHMDAGDELRFAMGSGDALAVLAVLRLRALRAREANAQSDEEVADASSVPLDSCAFLLHSLKHHHEVALLRKLYGPSFFLISAYAPQQERLDNLAEKIAKSHNRHHGDEYETEALILLKRDEQEANNQFGQNVRETFWRGDAYVDAGKGSKLNESVRRIMQIWFGHPFHTPTQDEYLMFCARAASYRSASLGRQVGAVIATKDGSIISTGTNEVPKAGGGHYWCDDENDARDHIRGFDSSDYMRRQLLGDMIDRLAQKGWTPPRLENLVSPAPENVEQSALDHTMDTESVIDDLLYGNDPIMKNAEFNALTEYQRPVHAEMSALTDAARRGIAVADATLYCTTFPCHGCARHIISAGMTRVVYIEPYQKSLAQILHDDSISVGASQQSGKVRFEPFVGLAPIRYMECFKMADRKDKRGKILKWEPKTALPRIRDWSHSMSVSNEENVVEDFIKFEKDRQKGPVQ